MKPKQEPYEKEPAPSKTREADLIVPRSPFTPAPLTFSQQWLWSSLRFFGKTRRSRRSMVVAKQIEGPLDLQCLRQALDEVIRAHEALRTRIVAYGTGAIQLADDTRECDLRLVDLRSSVTADATATMGKLMSTFVSEDVDIAIGPVFAAIVLQTGEQHHVFAFTVHHMIADGFSCDLVARQIWTTYQALVEGRRVPPIARRIQLADYAVWQQRLDKAWREQHEEYWLNRLNGAPRVRFPMGQHPGAVEPFSSGSEAIRFGPSRSQRLRELSRAARVVLSICVLALYAACLLSWRARSEMLLALIVSGRHHAGLESLVGFLSTSLYLRLQLKEEDTFRQFLEHVNNEYYNAQRHNDEGRLSAAVPGPQFTRTTSFNWLLPQAQDGRFNRQQVMSTAKGTLGFTSFSYEEPSYELDWEAEAEVWSAVQSDPEVLEWDPLIMLADTDGGIEGTIWYRADLHRPDTVAVFVERLYALADWIVQQPDVKIAACDLF